MSNTEERNSQTILRDSTDSVRLLTAAELEVVSGSSTGPATAGMPRPTCDCINTVGAGVIGAGIATAGGGK
jgi:hypothetical protein